MKRIITLLILFSCFLIKAQPPTRFYTKFGGAGVDIGYGVKQTLDGKYIVVGSTSSYGAGNTDVYLVKLESGGWVRWQKTFGGFGNDVGRSVIQLADSGYVLTGFTNSFGSGGYDALLIRVDKDGNQIWQKTFGGLDWDFAYDLVQAADGSIVICGTTSSFGNGNTDGMVIKFDLNGNVIWQKFFGGVGDDDLKSIIRTNDNMLATVGSNKSVDVNGNCYFLKLDLNGDTLFAKKFGGIYKDYANDIVQRPDNNYVIVGAKTYTANTHTESVIFEFNPSGVNFNELNFYASNTADEAWVAVSTSYAGPGYVAYIRNVPVPSYKMQGNIFVCKTSLYPNIVNSFGGIEDETIYAFDSTKDGGYVSVGVTNSFNASNGDVFLIKEDSTLVYYDNVIGIKENNEDKNVLLKTIQNNLYELELTSGQYETIIITNLYADVVYSREITQKNEILSLEEFPKGVYLLTLKSIHKKSITFKIINL